MCFFTFRNLCPSTSSSIRLGLLLRRSFKHLRLQQIVSVCFSIDTFVLSICITFWHSGAMLACSIKILDKTSFLCFSRLTGRQNLCKSMKLLWPLIETVPNHRWAWQRRRHRMLAKQHPPQLWKEWKQPPPPWKEWKQHLQQQRHATQICVFQQPWLVSLWLFLFQVYSRTFHAKVWLLVVSNAFKIYSIQIEFLPVIHLEFVHISAHAVTEAIVDWCFKISFDFAMRDVACKVV